MIQPGSHLVLDNVRQERTNEWRARNGMTKSALDNMPVTGQVALLVATMGVGSGIVGMVSNPTTPGGLSSAVVRKAGLGAAASWDATNLTNTSQESLSGAGALLSLTRRSTFPTTKDTASQPNQLSLATNGTSSLLMDRVSQLIEKPSEQVAYSGVFIGGNIALASNVRQRVGYATNGSRFIQVTINSAGSVDYNTFTDTGVPGSAGNIGVDGNLAAPHLDVFQYPGQTTITIVYRTNTANTWRIIEYNAATNTIAVNVAKAVNCDNCLCLLPDPDSTGFRFVALSSATPTVSVLRIDSAGATIATDAAIDTKAATQIAGCAYGVSGWMIVYQTATGIFGVKKQSGVITAALQLYSDLRITLHSNAWRQTGADVMFFTIGFHSTNFVTDPQDHYFIKQQFYDNAGAATMWPSKYEPTARMLPFDAGPALATPATIPQVPLVSTGVYELPLVRTSRISLSAEQRNSAPPQQDSRYSADVFNITFMSAANMTTLNAGQSKQLAQAAMIPIGSLFEVSEAAVISSHGLCTAPPQPALTPAAGGGSLTLLATYQYLTIVIARNDAGDEWRSPPSIPQTVTLTGGQNQVTVVPNICVQLENRYRVVTVEIFRTKANGSIFQKVASVTGQTRDVIISAMSFLDTFSDAILNSADFAYAQPGIATAPTTVTPAMSHIETYGQRLWGVNRDYRQQLWFTKKFALGRTPEFIGSFQISFIDEEGDITSLAQLDDKLIVFKNSAIYFVQGDGPDEAGTGSYPTATRVDSDVGAIIGSPVVTTGQEVYFVSARGIYMIDRSLHVQFIGAPVDQFLNQPLVQTKETVIGAVFSPATNEVRFQTTNYRLVYDRLRGLWYRDTGAGMQNVVSTCMVGSKQALFKSDGTMWIEGDETITQDNGVSFTPSIRSAWIRPAGTDGRLRLYMARIIMTRTTGGGTITPTLRIYYDNDESSFEFFLPSSIGGATLLSKGSVQPRRHRCSAFSLQLLFAANDDTLRLEAWGAEIGLRSGAFRNNSGTAERWT